VEPQTDKICIHGKIVKDWHDSDGNVMGKCADCGESGFPIREAAEYDHTTDTCTIDPLAARIVKMLGDKTTGDYRTELEAALDELEATRKALNTEGDDRVQQVHDRILAAVGPEFRGDAFDAVAAILDQLDAYRRIVEPPHRPYTLSGGTGGGKGQGTDGASILGQVGAIAAASTPEPPPTPGEGDVWQRVIDGLPPGPVRDACIDRRAFGIAKYGTPLQAFNGRDWLKDLIQEFLDAVAYSQQGVMEGAKDAAYFRDFALRMLMDMVVPAEVNTDRAQVAALGVPQ